MIIEAPKYKNMIRKNILTLIMMIYAVTTVYSQKEDDNIEFLRVQNQITNGNYIKALDILSNISSQGKTSTFYLSYRATCYEKLRIYDTAAIAYKQLYTKTKSFDAMKKVAEMKDKQDAKMNCSYCHGAGFYTTTSQCYNCNGYGKVTKNCSSCNGSGECSGCEGTGYMSGWTTNVITGEKEKFYFKCSRCRKTGTCQSCYGSGKSSSTCYQCNGSGVVTKTIYCNH
jgi:hypothetical protein